MKGAFKIANIFGIPVQMHWSFGLLGFVVWYLGKMLSLDNQGTFVLAMLFIALFVCVVLHEFGHALTARRFGVKTQDIILLPIGGMARLERLPEKPIHEFYVAAAGPMVNFVIALLLSPYFLFYPFNLIKDFYLTGVESFSSGSLFIPLLVLLNLLLAGFNMLPAFPMDGGRMLRSLLSIRLGRKRATYIASILGQLSAVIFFVIGIYHHDFILGFFGVFVFMAARNEYQMVKLDVALEEKKVGDFVRTDYTQLYNIDKMTAAVTLWTAGKEQHFLILDEAGKVVGVLPGAHIKLFNVSAIPDSLVAAHASLEFEELRTEDTLKSVVEKFQQKTYSILPVYETGNLIGVIDIEMLKRFLQNN